LCQIWSKRLVSTSYPATERWSELGNHTALVLLNLGDTPAIITADIGASSDTARSETGHVGGGRWRGLVNVRDVWANKTTFGVTTRTLSATVAPHEARLYRVWDA
jgi:hypothetical protein